jgi:hypothetical protein
MRRIDNGFFHVKHFYLSTQPTTKQNSVGVSFEKVKMKLKEKLLPTSLCQNSDDLTESGVD